MSLLQSLTNRNNKIIIAGAGGVALIGAIGIGILNSTPVYQVENSSGTITWQVKGDGGQSASGELVVGSGSKKVRLSPTGNVTAQGTMTGNHLYAGTLSGAGLTSCTNPTDKLQWDSTTRRFTCGTEAGGGGSTSTGALATAFDRRFVNTSGDTMTGALSIKQTSGTSTGNTFIVDTKGLVYDATNKRVGVNTTSPDAMVDIENGGLRFTNSADSKSWEWTYDSSGDYFYVDEFGTGRHFKIFNGGNVGIGLGTTSDAKLEVQGTVSGAKLYASSGLYTSGALVVKSSAMIQGALTSRGTLSGASLTVSNLRSCDTVDSNGAGVLVCGTDADTSQNLFETIAVSGQSDVVADSTTDTLTLAAGSNITLTTNAGTDTVTIASTASSTVSAVGQGLLLNSGLITLNTTNSGSLSRYTTQSGSIVFANVSLRSSGTLVVDGNGWVDGTLTVGDVTCADCINVGDLAADSVGTSEIATNGVDSAEIAANAVGQSEVADNILDFADFQNTLDLDAGTTLNFGSVDLTFNLDSSGDFIVSTGETQHHFLDTGVVTLNASAANADVTIKGDNDTALFVTDASADAIGVGTAAPDTKMEIIGTASGRSLRAQDSLQSSGTLVVRTTGMVQGNLTTRGNLSGASLTVSNLRSCDTIDTNGAGVLVCGTDGGGAGAVTAVGQGLSLNSGLLTLSTSNSGSLSNYSTQSGYVLYAKTSLRSSGTLVVDGNGWVDGTLRAGDVTCTDCINVGDLAANSVDASELAATTVSANSYGTALNVPAFTVDADGRLTAASVNTIAGITGTHVTDDTFDFVDLQDTLDLDATATINSAGFGWIWNADGNAAGDFQASGDTDGSLLFVDASADAIGIGTSSPDSKLHLKNPSGDVALTLEGGTLEDEKKLSFSRDDNVEEGYISMTDSEMDVFATGPLVFVSGASVGFAANNSSNVTFSVDSKTYIVISGATGNVGIGRNLSAGSPLSVSGATVINPTGKGNYQAKTALEVLGTISGSTVVISAGSASVPSLSFNHDTNTGLYSIGPDIIGVTTGGIERMRVNASGVVGIGTSSPGSKFSLSGAMIINPTGAGSMTAEAGLALEVIGATSGTILRAQDRLIASGSVSIKKYAASATGNILVVDTKGLVYDATNKRVGVGTASPGKTFEISDNLTETILRFNNIGDNKIWDWGYDKNNDYFYVDEFGSNRHIVIKNGGNVGIGTTSGETKLQVTGGGLCVGSSANCNTDNNTEGIVYSSATAMTIYDVAERYPTKDKTLTGTILLALDLQNPVFVKKAERGDKLIGIHSLRPAIDLGGFKTEESQFVNEHQVSVALVGRVPLLVTTENGEIKTGDDITISSIPGVGMKAERDDQSVGYALEPCKKDNPWWKPWGKSECTVQVFVHLSR